MCLVQQSHICFSSNRREPAITCVALGTGLLLSSGDCYARVMKPNFALTLSAEGLRLLQRAPSGWLLVGDAEFDSDTFGETLADLRAKAELLSPGAVRTKLVLPNDQIKYMTVGSTAKSEDEAEGDAEFALERATPYALDELAYDWSLDDGQLFLAAVARETLTEAEAFAVEHEFNPVSFVGLPEQNDFPGEPFFGVARSAKSVLDPTETVARDLQPIHVIGMAEIPEPEPEPKPEPEPEPTASPASEPAQTQNDVPATPPVSPSEATEDLAPPAPAEDQSEDKAEDAPDDTVEDAEVEDPKTVGEPAQEEPAAVASELAFSSVRANRDAPQAAAKPVGTAQPSDAAIGSVTAPSIPVATPEATATPTPLAGSGGAQSTTFQSKRAPEPAPPPEAKPTTTQASAQPATPPAPQTERQRMTLFGARKPENEPPIIRGKPRFMGLALTLILIIFLAAMAIWASFISEDGLAGLFGSEPEQIEVAAAPTPEELTTATPEELAEVQDVETAGAADPALSDGQAVLLPDTPELMSPEEAERRYIATGIWLVAPEQPAVPDALGNADVYLASIDPQVRTVDALALPDISKQHDRPPSERLNPAAAGTAFDLDERGLVKATPEGALTPEGITVYTGKPAVVPETLPQRRGDGMTEEQLARLAQIRPRARPSNLQENAERGQLGGRTLSELAAIRPKARPSSITPQAEPDDSAAEQMVITSLRPKARPSNFAQLVAKTKAAEPSVQTVAAAAPSIPSSASVARQATVKNALNLRQLNLIGINGKGGDRRALVRTSNGRYKTVKIGDRLDGGKVAAITETELRYTKNGQSVVLKMPRG